ncbi:Crp/Fnr family transcriptional regulator [Roseivirga sp.]|uniref:Crp/Fnr family transcriptional regulator n=1 Tax=Roseivirga sp. TaxID=1964215 RepID=UPI003B520078
MNTDLILSNISKHVTLNAEEQRLLTGLLSEESVKKNTHLLREGEPCQYLYFVNSGTLRAYCLNAHGKESTVMFGISDWWITDMHCYLNQLPSMVYLQAVSSCEVLKLSFDDLNSLLEEVPAFNTFFRILMQKAYCREQLRMIENLSIPAFNRYENFIQKYPLIARQVPLKHIASYLGVTPEFLSTARSRKD